MASYEDLTKLTGQLKRSAIDAYMRGNPVTGSGAGGWSIEGDEYVLSSASAGTARVSRPGADGQGGGDWSHSNPLIEWIGNGGRDETFRTAFDTIRSRIDKALAPWTDLPDPKTIATEVEECRVITRALSGAASVSDGKATGGGNIAVQLGLVNENLDEMSGATIANFKSKFLGKLGLAVGGLHAVSIIQGSSMAAEESLFTDTRRAVAEAVDNARAACDAIATSGGASLKVALKIAQWVVTGAKAYVTGGAGLAFDLTTLGISVVDTVTSDEAFQRDVSDYDTALTAFEDALKKINDEVKAGETALQSNINTNLNQIRTDKASYDLTLDPITSTDGIIVIREPLVDEITGTYMPTIASDLSSTASNTLNVTMTTAVRRDATIGLGATGPSSEFSELKWLLYELLSDLSWEVTNGAKNLEIAINNLTNQDGATQADLDQIATTVGQGSRWDPWD